MTALAVPEGLEPLAVWGPHTPAWVGAHVTEKIAWCKANIPDAGNALRAEFYQTSAGPIARVRYFARNDSGHRYYDRATRQDALEPEPVIVPLAELAPAHLLKG